MFDRRRWETDSRYYETVVTRDLLDDCILVKTWGGKFNRLGGSRTIAVGENSVERLLARIEKERARKGYVMVGRWQQARNCPECQSGL